MVLYNFKGIQVVPSAKDFLDIVLSKTQRKTPTEIHKNYAISRIRAFYMRKVKFTQQNYHDKLDKILTDFPLLDDIHPFYADLINILYDRDHYKLALGQINTAKHLIDNLAKDHVRLLKYGDSLYRCKQLKRAGMGRMCTIVKKLGPSLAYLEQVRQHLARLPSIDPTTRTLIVCGYPNVGKSSFMNKVTRANVEVQPYAFTTKALYVGHTDYKYIRWQVIDTPGILDHPLEERNTIEMQSITAMAHLQAAILFVLDISEQCGYTIKQQVKLFHSIKPLFVGKPLMVVVNKIDVVRPENVDPEDWALIESLADAGKGGMAGTQIVPMSTLTEEGVANVKQRACDALLEARVEKKLKANRMTNTINRIHVAMPAPRDDKERAPVQAPAPKDKEMKDEGEEEEGEKEESTLKRMQRMFEERLIMEQEENEMWSRGEVPGMKSKLWQERYLLKNPDWKFDKIPEIIDGKNIADFVDSEIDQMLEELEKEEEERQAKVEEERANQPELELDEEELKILTLIRKKKNLLRKQHQLEVGSRVVTREVKNREQTFDDLQSHLKSRGFDKEQAEETVNNVRDFARSRSRSASRMGRKRERDEIKDIEEGGMTEKEKKKARREEKSRTRTLSMTPKPGSGMKDLNDVLKAGRIQKDSIRDRSRHGKRGESDRTILTNMPKHLFSGKRGLGKTQRR